MDSMNRSNSGATSCGPGLASGCPWKLKAGASVSSKPWLDPSNNERWVTRALAGSVDSSTEKPWFCEVIITRPLSRSITGRSEEHTSELQSLMRISYAVFCLKKKKKTHNNTSTQTLPLSAHKPD